MRVGPDAANPVDRPTKRVIHLIPFDGIGGVEVAAQSMADGLIDTDTFFQKRYIFANPDKELIRPLAYLKGLRTLLRESPKLLIASLWRAYLLLILFKLCHPHIPAVTFLHSAGCAHRIDRILAWTAMAVSSEIWADSQQTIKARVPARWRNKAHVISFLLDAIDPPEARPLLPNFVFWGRLAAVKGLERSIRLFEIVRQHYSDAKFDIVGPNRGEKAKLERQVANAGLDGSVRFHGGVERMMCFELARNSTFYLQTSYYEGMAVSVVEAMQSGLVPIVTPVGEIPRYCHDGVNAIIVDDLEVAAQRVLDLLSDANAHEAMSRAAVAEWQDQPLYREDMAASINALLNNRNGNRKPANKMHDESGKQ